MIEYFVKITYNIIVDGRNSGKEKGSSPKLPFSHLETMNVILGYLIATFIKHVSNNY